MVHQRVAGAGVETAQGRAGSGRQQGEIGDPADVQHGARRGAAEDVAMEGRHQRGTLAAGGDVAAAEVADDVDTAGLGQQRPVVELQREAGAVELARAVTHGLAMRADGADGVRFDVRLGEQATHHVGLQPRQRIGREGGALQLVGARCVQRQKLGAECRRHGDVGVGHHVRGRVRAGAEIHQHAIDAVHRRAAHQTDIQGHDSRVPAAGKTRRVRLGERGASVVRNEGFSLRGQDARPAIRPRPART